MQELPRNLACADDPKVSLRDVVVDSDVLGILFSANHEQECRNFHVQFSKFLFAVNKRNKVKLNMIYVSGDKYEEGFNALMKSRPNYFFVKFRHIPKYCEIVKEKYGIDPLKELPKLFFFDIRKGKLITRFGVDRVLNDLSAKHFPWTPFVEKAIGTEFFNGFGEQVTIPDIAANSNKPTSVVLFFANSSCAGVLDDMIELHKRGLFSKAFVVVVPVESRQFQYKKWVDSKKFESSEREAADKWLMLRTNAQQKAQELTDFFKAFHYPCLVITDSQYRVIHTNAIMALKTNVDLAKFPWTEEEIPTPTPEDFLSLQIQESSTNTQSTGPKVLKPQPYSPTPLSEVKIDLTPHLSESIREVRDKGVITLARDFNIKDARTQYQDLSDDMIAKIYAESEEKRLNRGKSYASYLPSLGGLNLGNDKEKFEKQKPISIERSGSVYNVRPTGKDRKNFKI